MNRTPSEVRPLSTRLHRLAIAGALLLSCLSVACASDRSAPPPAEKKAAAPAPAATTAAPPAAATAPAAAPAEPAAASPAAAPAAPGGDQWVVLETSAGDVVIDLFEAETPGHAANFKKLVADGYYNGSPFHRVIEGFMAQGGGKWEGGGGMVSDVGYTIPAELHPDTLPHLRGSVAAARTNNPAKASSGSQFYICFNPQPMLDQMGYTVFGKVVSGMENVDKITRGTGGNGAVDPAQATVIKRAYMKPAA